MPHAFPAVALLTGPFGQLAALLAIDWVQVVSLFAATLQLVAYALMQTGKLASETYGYQLCNVVGSLIMTIVATINREYGFILMEGVWFLTSAYGLQKLMRRRPHATQAP